MSNQPDLVQLLIKMKTAVEIMRDVRPGDEASKEKMKLAMSTLETAMASVRIPKAN